MNHIAMAQGLEWEIGVTLGALALVAVAAYGIRSAQSQRAPTPPTPPTALTPEPTPRSVAPPPLRQTQQILQRQQTLDSEKRSKLVGMLRSYSVRIDKMAKQIEEHQGRERADLARRTLDPAERERAYRLYISPYTLLLELLGEIYSLLSQASADLEPLVIKSRLDILVNNYRDWKRKYTNLSDGIDEWLRDIDTTLNVAQQLLNE